VIGLCTDSNAQFPEKLTRRFGVEVVPLTVTVDGQAYLEGAELSADDFYARFAGGQAPVVATAAPGPGQFMAAYERLVAAGATEILSVHIGSDVSGTINAARLAAGEASVPVRIVDTGTASFAISCCLWEAAEAIAKGADLEAAAAVAERVAATVINVFVVQALGLARAGGRLAEGTDHEAAAGIPVLSLVGGKMEPIGTASTVDEAADAMAGFIRRSGTNLRVGVGIADAAAAPMWQALEDRLVEAPEVLDVVRYRVGPSVGVHTGPGTAGAVAYPAAV